MSMSKLIRSLPLLRLRSATVLRKNSVNEMSASCAAWASSTVRFGLPRNSAMARDHSTNVSRISCGIPSISKMMRTGIGFAQPGVLGRVHEDQPQAHHAREFAELGLAAEGQRQ